MDFPARRPERAPPDGLDDITRKASFSDPEGEGLDGCVRDRGANPRADA